MSANWTEERWRLREQETARAILSASGPHQQWRLTVRSARSVLRAYSTSFFLVTRFLPPEKRGKVEVIYAAVRYPDEIVDTFPITPENRLALLDAWLAHYERGIVSPALGDAVGDGLNCFAAAFAQVVREHQIPPEHYRSFIRAMRLDVTPRPFADLADLIDSYVYGSAIVVGFFLAHVYGPSSPAEFERALLASRCLGIALQLTNFLRDVGEDRRRGRVYLPVDMLRAEGLDDVDASDPRAREALNRILRHLSHIAGQHYAAAERDLDAFAPDCRMAIRACINVYRQLNERIGRSAKGIVHRESVPMTDKFRVLPPSKYWRLPLAYLGAI